MQYPKSDVYQLPTALYEMKEASKLVKKWGEIQQIQNQEERIVALVKWRSLMKHHISTFGSGIR